MYFIQGADQKEYGPVPAEQLRQWISENRLNRFSAARAEGEVTWKTLGDFPEFAEALGIAVPAPSTQPIVPAPPALSVSPAPPATTYFIQGADQKEYGPVSADHLRQWISENRLNRFSPARAEGEALWKTLGDFQEFAEALGSPAPIAPAASIPRSASQPTLNTGAWGGSATPSGSGLRPTPGISESVVAEKLRIPAIGIVVTGAIGVLMTLFGIASAVVGKSRQDIPPGMPPEVERMLKSYLAMAETFAVPINVLTLILSLVTLLAGIRMLQRRSYSLVMTGVILAIIPCFSACCCLGLPFGIWALVVLSNAEVKAAFR